MSKNPVQEKEFGKWPLIVSTNNNSINHIPHAINYAKLCNQLCTIGKVVTHMYVELFGIRLKLVTEWVAKSPKNLFKVIRKL